MAENKSLMDDLEKYEASSIGYYTVEDFEQALSFTLISEGFLRNEQTYGDAVTLKVKLHALVIGENSNYFKLPTYMTREKYIASLISSNNTKVPINSYEKLKIAALSFLLSKAKLKALKVVGFLL